MRYLLLLVALLLAPSALAQSAEQVLREALDRHASQMADVRDYTITQEVMGTTVTTYAEREGGAGSLDYTYYTVTPSGIENLSGDGSQNATPNPYVMMERIIDRARLTGTEDVDGTETHVLVVEDFGDLARELGGMPDQGGEFEIEEGTFYIGTGDGLIHRMMMKGTMTNEGRTSPIEMDTRLRDYRTVDGFTTPFQMSMTMKGMESQLSDEDRRSLEQARAQMEALPAAQREMMEKMMGDQFAKLDQMMAGEGFELEMNVTEVKVNTGRPE